MKSICSFACSIALSSNFLIAQQVPSWSVEIEPSFFVGTIPKVDDDPASTFGAYSFGTSYFKNVIHGGSLGIGYFHESQFGDWAPYSASTIQIGARYYFSPFKTIDSESASKFQITIRKRLSLYLEMNYGLNLNQVNPENNRADLLYSGLNFKAGGSLYLSRRFGINYGYVRGPAGPYFNSSQHNDKYRGNVFLSLVLTKLDAWPSTNHLASKSQQKSDERASYPIKKYIKPELATFTRFSFGYAPDVNPDVQELAYNPLFFTAEAGLFLPYGFEASLRTMHMRTTGSTFAEDTPDGSYWLYGGQIAYDIPIMNDRVRLLTGVTFMHGNHCSCGSNDGERRKGQDYIGFRPVLRYVVTPWLYAEGSMVLQHLLNKHDEKFGLNYPELALTVPFLRRRN